MGHHVSPSGCSAEDKPSPLTVSGRRSLRDRMRPGGGGYRIFNLRRKLAKRREASRPEGSVFEPVKVVC